MQKEIVTFTIVGTFPVDDVVDYCKRRGWQENSGISAIDYAMTCIKTVIVGDVSAGTHEKLIKYMEEEKQRVIANMNDRVKSAIEISHAEATIEIPEE